MFEWIKRLVQPPEPAGPPQTIRHFEPAEGTITKGVIEPSGDGWLVEVGEGQTIALFEVEKPGVEQCMLTYRAEMKSEDVRGRGYLEMWCRLSGKGEFFSKGFHNALKGSNDWASYEIPFYLQRGQRPDRVKLNLTLEGQGKVWLRNIELSFTPLA